MFARIAAIAFVLPALVSAIAIPEPQIGGAPGMGATPWGNQCPEGCSTVSQWTPTKGANHIVSVCIDGGDNKFYYVNGQGKSDKGEAAGIACNGDEDCQHNIVGSLPDLW